MAKRRGKREKKSIAFFITYVQKEIALMNYTL
jgi:hypothetical protein